MTDIEREALVLMESIGGGFAANLAKAWMRAYLDNQRRLKIAFGHLLQEYVKMIESRVPAAEL